MRFAGALAAALAMPAAALAQPPPSDAACIARPTRACVMAMALAAARAERHVGARNYVLWRAASAQAILGALDEARAAMAQIAPIPTHPAGVTYDVIEQVIAAGGLDRAETLVAMLPTPQEQALAWLAIADAHARAGRGDAAEAALARLGPTPSDHDRAVAEAIRGRAAEALDAARRIADSTERARALEDAALAHARAGRRAAALAAAQEIDTRPLRALALARVAEALGDPAPAAEAVATMRGEAEPYMHFVLEALVRVTAASGDIAGAAARARAIDLPVVRAWTLAELARRTADPALVAEALAAAQALAPAVERRSTLGIVAVAMLRAGREDAALALARGLDEPSARNGALGDLAAELAHARRPQDALRLALEISAADMRGVTLVTIARSLPQ